MSDIEIFVRLLDGNSRCFDLPHGCSIKILKNEIQQFTGIPIIEQRLTNNSKILDENSILTFSSSPLFIDLFLSLPGGKGGFGTLLRSSARNSRRVRDTGDMRDLSGRRIRHVTQSESLNDWKSQDSELTEDEKKIREKQFKTKLELINKGKLQKEEKNCKFGIYCKNKQNCKFKHEDDEEEEKFEGKNNNSNKRRKIESSSNNDDDNDEEVDDGWNFSDDCFTVPSDEEKEEKLNSSSSSSTIQTKQITQTENFSLLTT